MHLVNFRKKCRFFSFDFRQFDVQSFWRWLSRSKTKFFWWAIKTIFFFKMFTLVLLDEFLDGFSKFEFFIVEICILIWYFLNNFLKLYNEHAEHTWKRFYRTLRIRGNDFIACWAYAETISSHTEHTRKRFHSMLSIRGTNITLQTA